jgi:hypothetical protein
MNRRWNNLIGLGMMALIASTVSAQAPPEGSRDDLDVTMRVIVDPNAKVPDEIVHKIPLPKPGQPASGTAPQSDKPDKSGKPEDPGAKGKSNAAEARDQGREFGQQTAEQAKQRSEEARRNKPDSPPGKPPEPPGRPPGPPPRPGG